MELRDYQIACLDSVRDALIDHQRVLLEAPTGSGKTVMAAWMCDAVSSGGDRAYFVCHRRELVQQTALTFGEVGISYGVIAAGWGEQPEALVQIASIQTLARRLGRVPPPHVLILDECLPPETLVETPDGPRRIDEIEVGDMVLGMEDGRVVPVRVKHVFDRPRHSPWVWIDGVQMTTNHPVFTQRGWIPAEDVKVGDLAAWLRITVRHGHEGRTNHYGLDLCTVRSVVRDEESRPLPGAEVLQPDVRRKGAREASEAAHMPDMRRDVRGKEQAPRVLLTDVPLRGGAAVAHGRGAEAPQRLDAQGQCAPGRATEAPHASRERIESVPGRDRGGDPSQGRSDAATARLPEPQPGQRSRADGAAGAPGGGSRSGLGDGVGHPHSAGTGERVPERVQGGPRSRGAEDRGRVRRALPPDEAGEGSRREAGRTAPVDGLARPPVLEQGDPRGASSGGGGDRVLNLETECGNFFAHGLLVHNCHHVVAESWAKVIRTWPEAFVVGLSATPCRLDGRGLDEFFGDLVLGPSVAELIEAGWLSTYRLFAPSAPDLADVRTERGDYDQRGLAEAVDRQDLIGDIVDHYARHARGRKTIVFATGIAHSRHIVDRMNGAGIPAVHLDGTTAASERAAALRQFALGKYDVVSNVELFGEGFDLAANAGVPCTVECVVSARPTQSLSIWLQQVGRALRPKPEPAIILDHAGNALRHGLPDDPREWTLAGRRRSRREVDEGALSVRRCPQCFHVHRRELLACPSCGFKYVVRPDPRQMIQETDGELVELKRAPHDDPRQLQLALKRRQVQRARSFEALYAIGVERGYKKPASWAKHIMRAREEKRSGVAS